MHTSELVVPKGKRAHLQLSDGTRVWINSASVLRFPSAFGDTRDVFVEGEAYFEVAKDANRPFIVHTDHFATRVLGTSFDVTTAPRADGSSAVVLVEGSVAIDVANGESVTLNPSERFSMKDGSYSVYEVDPYKYISWKDGQMCIRDRCMYWALNHRALSGWNRAPDFETRSSEKLSISSCIEKISCSVPGFQPSSASMLMNASGKMCIRDRV